MSSQEDNNSKQKEFKIFNDSVHGHIKMHPLLVDIIDTPAFQRLRNIKQLGGGYFVFPGASHNRFEHSIGVAHLAGQLVQSLMDQQQEKKKELKENEKINEKDKLCVQIAGLCHDLGHGPFSHAFEDFMKELSKRKKASEPTAAKVLSEWKHEEQSIRMFQFLIGKEKKDEKSIKTKMMNGHYGDELKFENKDFIFIEELINGPKSSSEWNYRGRGPEKSFLFEIVSNKKTGIDVDKMDYFSRDCHHLGMKTNFSHDRYVMFARVCSIRRDTKQICMRDKEALNMYELFHVRYLLHNNVYTHRVKDAVETMIVDALLEAEDHFMLNNKKISEAATDPESFLRLTDNILQEIMRSSKSELESAKDIIKRIEERDLYQFVASRKYKPEDLPDFSDEDLKMTVVEEWLYNIKQNLELNPELNTELNPELNTELDKELKIELDKDDFIVKIVKLNYGMKEKNPINALRFYSKTDKDKAKKLPKEKVSYLLPERFAETKIMLFYKPRRSKWDIRDKLNKRHIEAFWETIQAFD